MSMFRCPECDNDYDSDYVEIVDIEDRPLCVSCAMVLRAYEEAGVERE